MTSQPSDAERRPIVLGENHGTFKTPASLDGNPKPAPEITLGHPLPTTRHRCGTGWSVVYKDKDWWCLWLGLLCFGICCAIVLSGGYSKHPAPRDWNKHPVSSWKTPYQVESVAVLVCGVGFMTTVAYTTIYASKSPTQRKSDDSVALYAAKFVASYFSIAILAIMAWWLSKQDVAHQYGCTFEVFGITIGMMVTNVLAICGCSPKILLTAATGEDYIKVGLVLLGLNLSSIGQLLAPALITSWVVTPIVLIFSFAFVAQRLLGFDGESTTSDANEPPRFTRSLSMMVSIGLAVCGSSAAAAVHSAIPEHLAPRKDDELNLTIALLNLLTIIQMIPLPFFSAYVCLTREVTGAWFGGSLDGTGLVVAAGGIYDGLMDKEGDFGAAGNSSGVPNTHRTPHSTVEVAATVKMIQNTLIGFVAIAVTMYWIAIDPEQPPRRSCGQWALEVWKRFPKFVLGFVLVSIGLTYVTANITAEQGDHLDETLNAVRVWWMTTGFVSVGLGTNIRRMLNQLQGGKTIVLYIIGQLFDLLLTFAAAYVSFSYLYDT